MSEKTTPALAKIDELLPRLRALPTNPDSDQLIQSAEALRRAVAAFHMEAIRFRMHAVDRLLRLGGDQPDARARLEHLRQALEDAGFHTRSHVAP